MNLAAGTEHLLQIFLILAGVLLIPVAIGLIVVLFKLAFLIHSTSEFLTVASAELTPMMKELRAITGRIDELTLNATTGVQEIGQSFQQAGPLLKQSLGRVKSGIPAFLSGIGRAFLHRK